MDSPENSPSIQPVTQLQEKFGRLAPVEDDPGVNAVLRRFAAEALQYNARTDSGFSGKGQRMANLAREVEMGRDGAQERLTEAVWDGVRTHVTRQDLPEVAEEDYKIGLQELEEAVGEFAEGLTVAQIAAILPEVEREAFIQETNIVGHNQNVMSGVLGYLRSKVAESPGDLKDDFDAQIKRVRDDVRMSIERLSERSSELGVPWDQAVDEQLIQSVRAGLDREPVTMNKDELKEHLDNAADELEKRRGLPTSSNTKLVLATAMAIGLSARLPEVGLDENGEQIVAQDVVDRQKLSDLPETISEATGADHEDALKVYKQVITNKD